MDEVTEVRRIIAEADPGLGAGFEPYFAEEDGEVIFDPVCDALDALGVRVSELTEWLNKYPTERAVEARRIAAGLLGLAELLDRRGQIRPAGNG